MNENEEANSMGEPEAIDLPEEVEQKLKEKDKTSYVGLAIVGTLSLFTVAGMLLPCMARAKGATVSSNLNWQDRQAEIAAAIQAADAADGSPPNDDRHE